jgi:hypothetical protein
MGFMFLGIVIVMALGCISTPPLSRSCEDCDEKESRDLIISRSIVEKVSLTITNKFSA